MSNSLINAVLELQDQSPTEKLVLLILANHANEFAQCWPSVNTIARETCLSRAAVFRTLAKLEIQGRLKRWTKGRTNGYTLVAHVDPSRSTTATFRVYHSDSPVADVDLKGLPRRPKPSGTLKEPQGNPPAYVAVRLAELKEAVR